MTVTNPAVPAFTNDDFAARMRRVVSAAVEKGLAGVIVTPGPDLVWAARSAATVTFSVADREPPDDARGQGQQRTYAAHRRRRRGALDLWRNFAEVLRRSTRD